MLTGLYDGLRLRRHYERTDEWLEILSADPQALFSGELLRSVRKGNAAPGVTLTKPEVGGVLRIEARNRTVVYRLVERDERDVFMGEWPD